MDRALLDWLYAGDSRGPIYFTMVVLSAVGGGWGMLAFVPLLASSRTRRFGAWLVGTLLGVTVVVFAVKALIGRSRPFLCVPGVRALCSPPSDPSFPSGHAAGSFAFAVFVSVWLLSRPMPPVRKWVGVGLAMAFAVGVGSSRVVLGVHFPSDVFAGGLLGCLLGWAGAKLSLA